MVNAKVKWLLVSLISTNLSLISTQAFALDEQAAKPADVQKQDQGAMKDQDEMMMQEGTDEATPAEEAAPSDVESAKKVKKPEEKKTSRKAGY